VLRAWTSVTVHTAARVIQSTDSAYVSRATLDHAVTQVSSRSNARLT